MFAYGRLGEFLESVVKPKDYQRAVLLIGNHRTRCLNLIECQGIAARAKRGRVTIPSSGGRHSEKENDPRTKQAHA